MKRFWTQANAVRKEGGWSVELDGRPVRTPARQLLCVPAEPLAQALAGEWNAAGETVDPRAMPLAGLANAALDRIAPDRDVFARDLARYGETDLLCYRANSPQALVERQEVEWAPLLAWARRRYDVDFVVTAGLTHVPQPEATVARLLHAVAALDPFRLAGLSPLVTIGGSLVAGLAVLEAATPPHSAWQAVSLDEHWQLEQWGSDGEAETALANKQRDFLAAAQFLALLA